MRLSTLPATQNQLRAFTYGRVSRDPKGRGTSVAAQNEENERICDERDWVIVGRYEDPDRSASRHARKSRPDYEAMVEALQRGEADVIVYWEASRAYRDLEVYVKLRRLCLETGVLLCYNDTIYDMSKTSDRANSARDAVQAETESDQIRDRVL